MTAHDDLGAVKMALRARIWDLLTDLGLSVKRRSGSSISLRNPRRADTKGGSFVIWTSPDKAGNWKDFATGDKGDVFGLIQYLRGVDLKEAIRYARSFTGIGEGLSDDERRRLVREAAALRAQADAEAEKKAKRDRNRAAQMWLKASPEIFGTPVETYALARGIDLRSFKLDPGAHRFAPSCQYWMGREEGKPTPCFPAILTAMRDGFGIGRALHFTFLTPDGRGKAPVEKPKLIWPSSFGTALRISAGASGLSAEDAPPRSDVLAFTEGVEDAWTLAQADPELRVWAAASLNGLLNAPIPASAAAIIVSADNDWGNPGAAKQLNEAVKRLSSSRPVEVIRSTKGKDFNDQLRMERGIIPLEERGLQ